MNDSYKLETALGGMREPKGIRFSDIHPSRLVYFTAYALELVLYQLQGSHLFNCGVGLFGLDFRTTTYVAHMAASLLVMLLWSDRFKPLIRVSVAAMTVGFIPWIFLPNGSARLAFAIVGMAGLGGAVTSARCGYAFATNNAEKLCGMTLMFAGASAVRILTRYRMDGVVYAKVLPVLLLIGLALCLLKFEEMDFDVKQGHTKSDEKGLYWALAFFIAFFAIDGYTGSLLTAHSDGTQTAFTIGCVLPCLIFPLLFTGLKLNTWHVWNIYFVLALGMGVCAIFAPQLGSHNPEVLLGSLSRIGWPLCIYTLGCAQRRFASYHLLKISTVVFVICSPLTTLSSRLIRASFPETLSVVAFVYVLVVVVGFLILSPFSYKHLFSAAWISDMYKSDMRLLLGKVEEVDHFENYELTSRQREVAALLLSGKTRRQVSGELGLSESTVKMHTAELYKRLNINSRNDLFRIFGVVEGEDAEKESNHTSV